MEVEVKNLEDKRSHQNKCRNIEDGQLLNKRMKDKITLTGDDLRVSTRAIYFTRWRVGIRLHYYRLLSYNLSHIIWEEIQWYFHYFSPIYIYIEEQPVIMENCMNPSLTRGQNRQRTARCSLNCSSSFAISVRLIFPRPLVRHMMHMRIPGTHKVPRWFIIVGHVRVRNAMLI